MKYVKVIIQNITPEVDKYSTWYSCTWSVPFEPKILKLLQKTYFSCFSGIPNHFIKYVEALL